MAKFRYTPVVRWKLNDRSGMSRLSASARVDVQPLILLWADQYADQKPSKAKVPPKAPRSTAAQVFARQVLDVWGRQPIFLDASDLAPLGTRHQLDDAAMEARVLHLNIIPATRLNYAQAYQDAVARMVSADGAGVALRISVSELAKAAAWIGAWPFAVSETDLIVDLEGNVADIASLGVAPTLFSALLQGSAWRSVTMVGGCIPQYLSQSQFPLGPSRFPRHELSLFNTLVAHGLPYHLNFGDYGSISTTPPADIDYSVPINAKYSLPTEFVIFKGVKIKGPGASPMATQLRGYAKNIVALGAGRFVLSSCAADAQIDDIAAGTATSGNPGTWVGLNLNRHIEVTRHHLP